MLLQMADFAPDLFFESSAFPIAFRVALAALTLVQTDIIFASLDLIRIILTHDCLSPTAPTPPPPKFPVYAAAIRQVIDKEGFELVGLLLTGTVGDFPEESTSATITIFRSLSGLWSTEVLSWVPPVLQRLPPSSAPDEAKARFMTDLKEFVDISLMFPAPSDLNCVHSTINAHQYDKVKYAILGLHRTSRKARDRRRMGSLS